MAPRGAVDILAGFTQQVRGRSPRKAPPMQEKYSPQEVEAAVQAQWDATEAYRAVEDARNAAGQPRPIPALHRRSPGSSSRDPSDWPPDTTRTPKCRMQSWV